MGKRELSETRLTLPQVKQELAALGDDNLDQFQRRTLDYVSKFSKIEGSAAAALIGKLTKDFGLENDEAVQVVNSAPESGDELRIFLAGGRKIIESAKLEAIVALLNEHRTSKQ